MLTYDITFLFLILVLLIYKKSRVFYRFLIEVLYPCEKGRSIDNRKKQSVFTSVKTNQAIASQKAPSTTRSHDMRKGCSSCLELQEWSYANLFYFVSDPSGNTSHSKSESTGSTRCYSYHWCCFTSQVCPTHRIYGYKSNEYSLNNQYPYWRGSNSFDNGWHFFLLSALVDTLVPIYWPIPYICTTSKVQVLPFSGDYQVKYSTGCQNQKINTTGRSQQHTCYKFATDNICPFSPTIHVSGTVLLWQCTLRITIESHCPSLMARFARR